MKSICFFNNKGGVGKTTLACNVASSIAVDFGLSVLLVDADPQCNATQLVLTEDLAQTFYVEARKSSGTSGLVKRDTLFDVLKPIARGEPSIKESILPLPSSRNRFRVDLIPGHPRVALLEDLLSQSWAEFSGGIIGGARKSNWAYELCHQVAENYDIILFDVGPSLGALNRTVLIGSDYFVTPMGCDIFSLMGIRNISDWLSEWQVSYLRGMETCKGKWSSDDFDELRVRSFSDSPLCFAGYAIGSSWNFG